MTLLFVILFAMYNSNKEESKYENALREIKSYVKNLDPNVANYMQAMVNAIQQPDFSGCKVVMSDQLTKNSIATKLMNFHDDLGVYSFIHLKLAFTAVEKIAFDKKEKQIISKQLVPEPLSQMANWQFTH